MATQLEMNSMAGKVFDITPIVQDARRTGFRRGAGIVFTLWLAVETLRWLVA